MALAKAGSSCHPRAAVVIAKRDKVLAVCVCVCVTCVGEPGTVCCSCTCEVFYDLYKHGVYQLHSEVGALQLAG